MVYHLPSLIALSLIEAKAKLPPLPAKRVLILFLVDAQDWDWAPK